MTISVEIETRIGRPPAEVFAALADVERYPEWLIASGIVRVERLDPGPLAAGSRLRIAQTVAGRSTVLDGSITVLVPGAAFGLRGKDREGVSVEIDAVMATDERGHAPALVGPGRAAVALPDVRIDGRATGQAGRGTRSRGAQAPAGGRPGLTLGRAAVDIRPSGRRVACRCRPPGPPPTFLTSGSDL